MHGLLVSVQHSYCYSLVVTLIASIAILVVNIQLVLSEVSKIRRGVVALITFEYLCFRMLSLNMDFQTT